MHSIWYQASQCLLTVSASLPTLQRRFSVKLFQFQTVVHNCSPSFAYSPVSIRDSKTRKVVTESWQLLFPNQPLSKNSISKSTSIKEYFKRYESNSINEKNNKERTKTEAVSRSIPVVEEDPVMQKPVKLEEEENGNDSAGEKFKTMSPSRQRRARYGTPLHPPPGFGYKVPPRQRQRRYCTPSPEPEPNPSNSNVILVADDSPPRKNRRDSDQSGRPLFYEGFIFVEEEQKAGLVSSQDFMKDNAKSREDSAWYNDMDPSVSERGAEPVYCDKVKVEHISSDEFPKPKKGEEKLETLWGRREESSVRARMSSNSSSDEPQNLLPQGVKARWKNPACERCLFVGVPPFELSG